jgi:hypothetical protein
MIFIAQIRLLYCDHATLARPVGHCSPSLLTHAHLSSGTATGWGFRRRRPIAWAAAEGLHCLVQVGVRWLLICLQLHAIMAPPLQKLITAPNHSAIIEVSRIVVMITSAAIVSLTYFCSVGMPMACYQSTWQPLVVQITTTLSQRCCCCDTDKARGGVL